MLASPEVAGSLGLIRAVLTAVSSLHGHLREHPAHVSGWAFGGVSAGIALSDLLVLALRSVADWRAAWLASAALAAVLTLVSWRLRPERAPVTASTPPGIGGRSIRTRRWFSVLFASYTLEGIGYIVAGTFLVAAIEQSSPGWISSGAWVLVGLAAVPSSAPWTRLRRRWSYPDLLVAALVVQAVGIVLPALIAGVTAALTSAVPFGATFIGVSTLALAAGAHLHLPRAVALLTAGYSVGQILGLLAVTPMLRHGYHQALILAAIVVLAAGTGAAMLRVGVPHEGALPREGTPVQRPSPAEATADPGSGD
ncbi:YbfB/YjiJ family MFS transporter [Actinopolymorpha pittospori]|uniref:MFS family arabinose efflux permease n=1 Tax=Actinopolymorpha pittospori TaxID=648752 RepID=A0A927R6A0_9ACTN|nr:putative MFS family arabinose efflux permease [Actinopolymorpha pittospori]